MSMCLEYFISSISVLYYMCYVIFAIAMWIFENEFVE